MRNKAVKIIALVSLAPLLWLAIDAPNVMIQPGKLIDSHMQLTDDCFACHSPFIGSVSEKCTKCHALEEIGLKTTKGLVISQEKKNVAFHQKLIEGDCIACHSDHKGVQAFRPIGQFSHQLIELDVQQQCDSCHGNPGDALHLKIKGGCSQCHTTDAWMPATFEHRDYFRFDREHPSACETCHINNDYRDYTCYGCHEHSRSKIREEHVEEGIRNYEKCVECHRSGDEDEAKRIWRTKQGGRDGHQRDGRHGHDDHHDDDDDDD